MAKKKRRWIPWAIGGIVVVLGLGYAVFAQTGIPHYYFAAPAIYAKAKALGVPMTAEEFDPPREGENAGPEYVLLCQQVEETRMGPGQDIESDLSKLVSQTSDSAKILALMEEKGRLYGPLIDQMEELSKLPICQIPRNYEDPVTVLLPELASFKDMAKQQINLASLDALNGRRDRAVERLRSIVRMSDQVRQGPLLIEFLVATACHDIAIAGARRCMAADPRGATAYADAIYENAEREKHFPRVLRNEMYFFVETMRNYDPRMLDQLAEGSVTSPRSIRKDGLPAEMYNRAAMAYGLEAYMPVLEEIGSESGRVDRVALQSALKEFGQKIERRQSGLRKAVTAPASILLPIFSSVVEQLTGSETRKKCLDVLAEWVETGRRPTDIPIDPYSGAPLILREEGTMLVVYSVGRNKKDDGGELRNRDDITMYYTPGEWWR